jgi:RND family efflux transporter MFP subunit
MQKRWTSHLTQALLVVLLTGVLVSLLACQPNEKSPDLGATAKSTSNASNASNEQVEISPQDVTRLSAQELISGLPITGNLRANKDAFIKARVAGELMDMHLKEGDPVEAGQILGRIDPVEYQRRLKQAQETADAAKAQIDIAQRQYENNKALVEQGFISKTALESSWSNLQTAQATFKAAQAGADVASKALEDSILRAPFKGQVSARLAQSGERLGVDAKILEILDISQFEVETTVSAMDSLELHVGQVAQLHIEGSTPTRLATLVRINPSTQTGSRNVLAYLRLQNNDGLRQGLFAQGVLNLKKKTVLCVPSKDIQNFKSEPFVQIIQDGVIKHQTIQKGVSGYLETSDNETQWTEILGVPADTPVLKAHLGMLRAGVRVQFTTPETKK